MRKLLHLVIHQRDIRRVHGNIAAYAARGDAHVRFFQGRRVVDPVADHAHRLSLLLILSDGCQLILRQAVGPHLTNLPFGGNGRGGVFMVAGQQHGLNAQLGKRLNRGGALLTQRV